MSKESYIRGFCKAAEAHGVDPAALAKYAAAVSKYDPTIAMGQIAKDRTDFMAPFNEDNPRVVFEETNEPDGLGELLGDPLLNRGNRGYGGSPSEAYANWMNHRNDMVQSQTERGYDAESKKRAGIALRLRNAERMRTKEMIKSRTRPGIGDAAFSLPKSTISNLQFGS